MSIWKSSPVIPAPPPFTGVTFQRAGAEDRYPALALLLTGRVATQTSAVDQFLQYAAGHDLALELLWTARQGKQPVAAALVLPCAGRTAMAFVSASHDATANQLAALLLDTACRQVDARQVQLVQGLLEPAQQTHAQVFTQAGFWKLATLIYLQAEAPPPETKSGAAVDVPLELPAGVQAVTWSESRRDLFAQAILASYEQTQDCPKLRGLRKIEDIIAGHMASGRFVPELWLALREASGAPGGVMLLNELEPQQALELVYLGLAPSLRGQGVGSCLLRHGLRQAARHKLRHMICAVDAANPPALALYQRLGFVATGRKEALVRTLG